MMVDFLDFYRNPSAFWRADWFNPLMTIIGGITSAIALILAIVLLVKYRRRHAKSLLFLGLAFLAFTAGIIAALPTQFTMDPVLEKIYYGIAKLISLVAVVFYFKFALTIFHSRENSSKSLSLVQVAFFVLNASLIIADALIAIFHLKMNEGMGSMPRLPPALLLVQEIIVTLPFLYMFVMAWKLSKKAGDPNDQKALMFIAISGLLKFGSYMSMFVNDFIGFRNPWSIGIWSCAMAAFMTFYIGVTRPAILFKKTTGK